MKFICLLFNVIKYTVGLPILIWLTIIRIFLPFTFQEHIDALKELWQPYKTQ